MQGKRLLVYDCLATVTALPSTGPLAPVTIMMTQKAAMVTASA